MRLAKRGEEDASAAKLASTPGVRAMPCPHRQSVMGTRHDGHALRACAHVEWCAGQWGYGRPPRWCARCVGTRPSSAPLPARACAEEGRPASTSARRDHACRGTPIDARSPSPSRDAQAACCGRGPATKRAVTRKQASGRREGAVVDLPHPPILGIEFQAVRGRRTRAEV